MHKTIFDKLLYPLPNLPPRGGRSTEQSFSPVGETGKGVVLKQSVSICNLTQ